MECGKVFLKSTFHIPRSCGMWKSFFEKHIPHSTFLCTSLPRSLTNLSVQDPNHRTPISWHDSKTWRRSMESSAKKTKKWLSGSLALWFLCFFWYLVARERFALLSENFSRNYCQDDFRVLNSVREKYLKNIYLFERFNYSVRKKYFKNI